MSAAAVIVRRQNEYMRVFRNAGAVSPNAASTLADLHLRHSWVFDRMVARGVFVAARDDRWYLSEPGADAFVRRRRKIMLWFVTIAAIVFIIVLVYTAR